MPKITLRRLRSRKNRSIKPAEYEPKKAGPTFASGPVLAQQAFGNQAVQRMLQVKLLRAQFTINPPDDKYEKEADQASDTVMHMPDTQAGIPSEPEKDDEEKKRLQTKPLSDQSALIQRDEIPEDEERKKKDEEKQIQTKSISGQDASLIQRKAEAGSEEEQKKKEEEQPLQTKLLPGQDRNLIQRDETGKKDDEEKKLLQTKPLLTQNSLIQRDVESEDEEKKKEDKGKQIQTLSLSGEGVSLVQREADSEEDEKKKEEERPLQTKQLPEQSPLIQRETKDKKEDEEKLLQKKCNSCIQKPSMSSIEATLNSQEGAGHPLDEASLKFFGQRLGHNFSGVRVHSDSIASRAAGDLNAQAFTTGSDIYFGAGRFQPGSEDGKRLLAHELTHTVQQGSVSTSSPNISRVYGAPDIKQVQRYESYEHAEVSDKARLSEKHIIKGVELTSGEIDALGDFYATPSDLMNADPKELAELVRLIRKQKADPRSVTESDWDNATKGRYTELNLRNQPHFGPRNPALIGPPPGTPAGPDNRTVWINYHTQALGLARASGAEPDLVARNDKITQAKIINSFGEHYLTDMFSAGHLFSKEDTVALVQKNISGLSPKELDLVLKYVADWIWGIPSLKNMISQYESTAWHHADINSADRFKKVLEEIHKARPQAVANAIVKYVHDQLDTYNAGGVPGIQVENDYSTWLLSGDKTLRGSVDTQNWMIKAIDQARTNIQIASQNTTTQSVNIPPDADMIKQVLAYVPRPTADSTKLVHDLLAKVTDPKNRPDFATAVAMVIAGELPSILDQIVKEKKLQKINP